jgi:hypothetical protein
VRQVAAREQMTWPILFDGGMIGGPIATGWNIKQWPGVIRCRASMQNVESMVVELVARAASRSESAANVK